MSEKKTINEQTTALHYRIIAIDNQITALINERAMLHTREDNGKFNFLSFNKFLFNLFIQIHSFSFLFNLKNLISLLISIN